MNPAPAGPRPRYLDGDQGPLYALHHRPPRALRPRRGMVHVPAFGEEMNRARRMVALTARALAQAGTEVLVLDLHGTGDSAGDIAEATWEGWRRDVVAGLAALRAEGCEHLSLWGLRLGALLAAEMAADPAHDLRGLLLWQPVLRGATFVHQFLRLRSAAGLIGGERESVKSLRERLREAGRLEVAGYGLGEGLVAGIEARALVDLPPAPGIEVLWLEVGDAEGELAPASRPVVEGWRELGRSVHAELCPGEPFWSTQEIAEAPALVEVTRDRLGGGSTTNPAEIPAGAADDGAASRNARGAAAALPTPTDDAPPMGIEGGPGGEWACVFPCVGERLQGVLHPGAEGATRGVLVVVGGPQYRVGSHRQFVRLARSLVGAGMPVLRFDYRGMGDSTGEARDFEAVEADVRAAVDCLCSMVPGLREVVIWGLCDAASAACFYAGTDARVAGLVLLNPWVRTEQGVARAWLRHYYLGRLRNPAFWARLRRGEVDLAGSLAFIGAKLRTLARPSSASPSPVAPDSAAPGRPTAGPAGAERGRPLPERMAFGLERFAGPVLLILSGRDLTADEFRDQSAASQRWRRLLSRPRVTRRDLAPADHTFSRHEWAARVEEWTLEWLEGW